MEKEMIGKYVIIRADRAGVFAGTLVEKDGTEVKLRDVRRLWRWDGANSISELAVNGTNKAKDCNFTVVVDEMIILGVIEIIPCTEKAEKSIKDVEIWKY